jgi:hypothetical protein
MSERLVEQDNADQRVIFRILYRFSVGINEGAPLADGGVNAMYRGVPIGALKLPKHGVAYEESYHGAQQLIRDIDANMGNR